MNNEALARRVLYTCPTFTGANAPIGDITGYSKCLAEGGCSGKGSEMSGTIATKSRIEMLFLTMFKGHSLFFTTRRPRLLLMGVILYDTTWVLLPGA
ncbi:MAG: hypothetical protein DHS20C16_34070 [Phycisphaerae bacterium]|nr:MAG: hypothetical protein DHS20C16_34070 [Phycisphaerae bacterium]